MYLKTMELREGWRERERESELSKMRAFWHARAHAELWRKSFESDSFEKVFSKVSSADMQVVSKCFFFFFFCSFKCI